MTDRTHNNPACFLLLVAAHLALVWLIPFFPTQDGPSHVYNLAILHDLLHGGREWGGAFRYELSPAPNLGFHAVAYPLLALVTPLAAERLFISIYIVSMAVAVAALLKSFGKPVLPLSYLLFPVLFNFPFMMGFYSYAIAIPLFLLGLCLAWRLRDGALWRRFLCVNLAGAVIYLFHMVAFLMFLASVAAITLARCRRTERNPSWWLKEAAVAAPLLLTVLIYVARAGDAPVRDFTYLASPGRVARLAIDLFSFSTVTFHNWQILPAAVLMFFVAAASLRAVRDARERKTAGEPPDTAKTMLVLLTLMLLIPYFLAPFRFGEGSFFNERFPWVILLVALPLLELPQTPLFRRFGAAALAGTAWLFLALNALVLTEQSGSVERFVTGLGGEAPRQCSILTYKKRSRKLRVDPLLHASSYYGLSNGCVDVGNYEAQVAFFPVRFKAGFPATPSLRDIEIEPANIKWDSFPGIQYLLGWQVPERDCAQLAREFAMLRRNGELTLWKRK